VFDAQDSPYVAFCRLAECFDKHSLFDATIDTVAAAQPAAVNNRNVIPGAFLGKRFVGVACSVLFSATLSGRDFHRDMLGLPADVCELIDRQFRRERGNYLVFVSSFAEAIDLPGTRLIRAFIATLGLPQVNAINEQMMQRMQTR